MASAKSVEELEHYALRNALYHTARRQFLERATRLLNFVAIVGGAGTLTDVLSSEWRIVLGLVITVAAASQLVFDFGTRARDHAILQQRYYSLLSRIQEGGKLTEAQRYAIMGELYRISGDEPPTFRALDAVAYNQATDALLGNDGKQHRIYVTRFQSVTRNLVLHERASFDG